MDSDSRKSSQQPFEGRDLEPFERLILIPTGGICNRLRAIASGLRLCRLSGARFSLVWEWGDFARFFAEIPSIEIIRSAPADVQLKLTHRPMRLDPNREVDLSARWVELRSGYVFWQRGTAEIYLRDVLPYLPRIHDCLGERVDRFARAHFNDIVGLHMRRTDNKTSATSSPDRLFVERAADIVATGKKIFLATDNAITENLMRGRFGDAILSYPKRQNLSERWPRPFDPIAMEDDLIDLFLLARTEYVLGSSGSSYSGLAIALNGSRESQFLRVSDGQ